MSKIKLCCFHLYDQIVVSSQYFQNFLSDSGIDSKFVSLPVAFRTNEKKPKNDCVIPRILAVVSRECRSEITNAVKAFKLVKQKYPRAEIKFLVPYEHLKDVNKIIDGTGLFGLTVALDSDEQILSSIKWADVLLNGGIKSYPSLVMLKAMATGVYEGLEKGLEVEADSSEIVRNTKDRIEGFNAFLEKRAPVFTGE